MRALLLGLAMVFCGGPLLAGPGLELQGYPAGVQATARWEQSWGGRQAWLFYGGYNLARRWAWGLHADERGGGPGLGLGWRVYLRGQDGLYASLRTELWALDIAWRDATTAGLTEVKVLQPALELGWKMRPGPWGGAEVGLSLGQEINVDTQGESVAQGPILRARLGWDL